MGLYSFTKANRLLKRPDFMRLSTTGFKIHNRHVTAIYSPGLSDQTRLGVTVSRKVGHAAIRNKVKRLSREYFRLNRHTIKGVWDINIIAKKSAAGLPALEYFSSLCDIFDRISKNDDN